MYGMARYQGAQPPLPCWCGGGPTGRLHAFWDCPIAQAVCEAVTAARAGWHLTRECFWLVQQPRVLRHQPLWDVTALAALAAMDSGRRSLEAACLEGLARQQQQAQQQPVGTAGAAATAGASSSDESGAGAETSAAAAARAARPPRQRRAAPRPAARGRGCALQRLQPGVRSLATRQQLQAACLCGVEAFWDALSDFVSLHPALPEGWPSLPAGQQLLSLTPGGRMQAGPGPSPATVAALVDRVVSAHEARAAARQRAAAPD